MRVKLFLRHPAEKGIVVDVHVDIPVQLSDVHLHRIAPLPVFGKDALDVAAKVLLHRSEHLDTEELAHDGFLVRRELRCEERGLKRFRAAHCTALHRGRGCR